MTAFIEGGSGDRARTPQRYLRVHRREGSQGGAFARVFSRVVHLEHTRSRHHAPQANTLTERFNQSPKKERLYLSELDLAAELADRGEDLAEYFNEVRRRECLGFTRPPDVWRSFLHLLGPRGVSTS